MATHAPHRYPATLDIDAPEHQGRLSVFFRMFLALPHLVALMILGVVQSIATVVAWFVILITGRYPAALLKFSTGVMRWNVRAAAYGALLTDHYPPFSTGETEDYPVRPHVDPEMGEHNRWTTFFRGLLIIPHAIVLGILEIGLFVAVLVGWVAALINGAVPASMHRFIGGVARWTFRLEAYALFITDKYPPFSMAGE